MGVKLLQQNSINEIKKEISGPYLGQIASRKKVGAQNGKCLNRDMSDLSEIMK